MKDSERVRVGIEILRTNGWAKGYFARDEDGIAVECYDPLATCFCATGAMARGTENDNESQGWALTLSYRFGRMNIRDGRFLIEFNDNVADTKEEVMEAMEDFAKALEAMEDTGLTWDAAAVLSQ
jgi:hypothetical protein